MPQFVEWTPIEPDNPQIANRAWRAFAQRLDLATSFTPGFGDLAPSSSIRRAVESDPDYLSPQHFALVTCLVLAKLISHKDWDRVAFLAALTSEVIAGKSKEELPSRPSFEALASEAQGQDEDSPEFRDAKKALRGLVQSGVNGEPNPIEFENFSRAFLNSDYSAALEALNASARLGDTDTYYIMCRALVRFIDLDLRSGGSTAALDRLPAAEVAEIFTIFCRLDLSDVSISGSKTFVDHCAKHHEDHDFWREVSFHLTPPFAERLLPMLNRPELHFAVKLAQGDSRGMEREA